MENSDYIAGGVIDKDGLPMVGANVYISDHEGNYTSGFPGTVVQPDGSFFLDYSEFNFPQPLSFYSWSVSFVGFRTQTFELSDNEKIVEMQFTAQTLPTVVITPDDDKPPRLAWLFLPIALFIADKLSK